MKIWHKFCFLNLFKFNCSHHRTGSHSHSALYILNVGVLLYIVYQKILSKRTCFPFLFICNDKMNTIYWINAMCNKHCNALNWYVFILLVYKLSHDSHFIIIIYSRNISNNTITSRPIDASCFFDLINLDPMKIFQITYLFVKESSTNRSLWQRWNHASFFMFYTMKTFHKLYFRKI